VALGTVSEEHLGDEIMSSKTIFTCDICEVEDISKTQLFQYGVSIKLSVGNENHIDKFGDLCSVCYSNIFNHLSKMKSAETIIES
jgi:hypothetical protein